MRQLIDSVDSVEEHKIEALEKIHLREKVEPSGLPARSTLFWVFLFTTFTALSSCVPPSAQYQSAQRQESVCAVYAREAVRQNQANLERSCGFSGARWTSDYPGHFRWCMGVDITYSAGEMARRDEMLAQQCRSVARQGSPDVAGSSPVPGKTLLPEEQYPGEYDPTFQPSDWIPLDEVSEGVEVGVDPQSQGRDPAGGSAVGQDPWAPYETVFTPKDRRQGSEPLRPLGAAEPGLYETTTAAIARTAPSASGSVAARLPRGTILNVTGSEGDWLVVYSKKRDMTAYVRREEAMFSANQNPARAASDESHWKEMELRIREVLLKWGISNLDVTFIGDTAYLKGNVETDRERERAELAARTLPEVSRVMNWIRVSP